MLLSWPTFGSQNGGVGTANFNGSREARAEEQAYDASARARLRKVSDRLVDAPA